MSEKINEEEAELRAVERLDAGEAATSEEEARLRAPYETLIARIRDTEEAMTPPPGWQARAMTRWSAQRRRRRSLRVVAASISAMAATAAILLVRCLSMTGLGLGMQVLAASQTARSGGAVVGDTLKLSSSHGSILLYRDGRPIAQCPGDIACRRDGSTWRLDWPLAEPGEYDILSLRLDGAPWVPRAGSKELDLLQARERGAERELKHQRVSR